MTDLIMAQLRTGTRPAHAAIENTALGRALLGGDVREATYAAQLTVYRELHEAIAQVARLHAFEARSFLLAGSFQRVGLLRDDLTALRSKRGLGGDLVGPAGPATRVLAETIAKGSLPAALGAAYVFEGAAMGNRLLAPVLVRALSLADDESAYYRGHGERAGSVFRSFAREMDAAIVHPAEQSETLASAVRVFGSLADIFRALSGGEAEGRFAEAPAA